MQAAATLRCSRGVEIDFYFCGFLTCSHSADRTHSKLICGQKIFWKVDHRLEVLTHQFSCTCSNSNFVDKNWVISSKFEIEPNFEVLKLLSTTRKDKNVSVNFDRRRFLPIKTKSLLIWDVLQKFRIFIIAFWMRHGTCRIYKIENFDSPKMESKIFWQDSQFSLPPRSD